MTEVRGVQTTKVDHQRIRNFIKNYLNSIKRYIESKKICKQLNESLKQKIENWK